jgi:FkbM family methyltransferase
MAVKNVLTKPMLFVSHHLYTTARRWDPAHQPAVPMYYTCNKLDLPWMKGMSLGTILEVGANTGGLSAELAKLHPRAKMVLFEPLPDCFAELQQRFAADPRFVLVNAAVGDQAGELEFNRCSASHSSSFLPMTSTFKAAFPHVAGSEKTKVRVDRLDSLVAAIDLPEPIMAKLDTQGFEDRVLRGGQQTMRRVKFAIVETSFEPLYQGQPLFAEIYRMMAELGFRYAGAREQLCNPEDGRIMVQDSYFVR